MNWDALGAIAESVGAIGVVASLVYLAIQLRHNSKTISEESFQNLLNNYHGAMDRLISDPVLNRIWHTGLREPDVLDKDERTLWITQMHAFLRRYENIILQSQKYPVNTGVITGIQNQWHWMLEQPGARKFWPKAYSVYSDEFVEFVERRHHLKTNDDSSSAHKL
jgi:hypothetical protein